MQNPKSMIWMGETLYGSNEILKDKTAIIHYIFTEANTASVVIVTTP